MKAILIAAALLAIAAGSPAAASGPQVARLVGISGTVLVSTENSIASAGEALRLSPGMRILVTPNSAATIEYKEGCRVRLRSGDRLDIRGGESCPGRATSAVAGLMPVGQARR
jgi:hypothetical protein